MVELSELEFLADSVDLESLDIRFLTLTGRIYILDKATWEKIS